MGTSSGVKRGAEGKAARRRNAADGASIYDVAREADVSIVTVSRVFNDYPHVSKRMRERVFAAARRVGYSPRLVSKPRTIAAIIGHLDHLSAGDYKTRLLLHIIRETAKNGFLVEFIPYDAVELATKHLVDGLIEVGLTSEELLKLERLPQAPLVVINKSRLRPEWSVVASDHREEAVLATRHLRGHGHRRIALVLDERSGWGVEERRKGYTEALGSRAEPVVHYAAEEPPMDIARKMLAANCTACVNFTDNFGFAVLDCLTNALGVDIPGDMSMVCLENASVSEFMHPRLTTIEQPLRAIAEEAVAGIARVLGGDKRRFSKLLHSRLIERGSVRRPAKA
ncbi:MAG: LacI family DNA-binding transcriptional regulator [Kiritimatiellae bacterium]|nr:LacI family DNA-binding transcriptional regulator [Kiritimatiellia bacterium]